ncbi:MAG: hypothetical protein D6797_05770, partial [Bdellovibrio sp.]
MSFKQRNKNRRFRQNGGFSQYEPLYEKLKTAKDYSIAAKKLIRQGEFEKAASLLREGREHWPTNPFLVSQLIKIYGPYKFREAKALFEEAKQKGIADDVTYNTVLNIYAKRHNLSPQDLEKAQKLFEEAKQKGIANEVSYATMLNIYANSSLSPQDLEKA